MKTIVFFNNKGGVGKTSLVYHMSYLFADSGLRVLAVDLDPQANLTTMFLDEDRLEDLWPDGLHPETILGVVQPIMDGTGDIAQPQLEPCVDNIHLVAGDLGLSIFEANLSDAWPRCLDSNNKAAFRCATAFYRTIRQASAQVDADLILIDVGPNLGAINRAAMITADYVIVPLSPDLFSLQGLKNLGPTLIRWRNEWKERLTKAPGEDEVPCPSGSMKPSGYILMQHAIRLDRPIRAYDRWAQRIPDIYRTFVLGEKDKTDTNLNDDPYFLSMVKHYRSLMPLAMDARKPIFNLLPADGAIGAHMDNVRECRKDFEQLAHRIADAIGIILP